MKFRAAVLLFGALLIAALPAAADGIFHPGVEKEFSGISLNDSFDGGRNVDVWDSRSFLVANAFLFELRNEKFRHDGVIDWNLFERGSFAGSDSKDWSVDNQDRGWDKPDKKEDFGATAVPEPGSLMLLLFGFATVGLLAPRRMISARTL